MERKVMIGETECMLKISAAVPRLYRLTFNSDVIVGMEDMSEHIQESRKKGEDAKFSTKHITMLENLCYILHKHGDNSQPDSIEDWLEQFNISDIYDVFPVVIEMWNGDNEQLSKPKKKQEK